MQNSDKIPVLLLGDIHGQFARLRENIDKLDLRDCILICVGDLGIGFQHPAKGELHQARKMNTFFLGRNIKFMSIRGNHDDPQYFNGPRRIVLSNFILLPDYHAEVINGERWLFVGGATSIDRNALHRVEGRSWWRNEALVLDESKVTAADVLVTHTSPTWIGPLDKEFIVECGGGKHTESGKKMWEDCLRERLDVDRLLDVSGAKRIYCGHFHEWRWVEFNDVYGTILDIDQIIEHRPYE